MHFVDAKTILSNKNGMNIYRGCTHGCIYCDSRSSIYNMQHDFEDVEIKQNSIELLKKELQRKKEKCMIATGSMTDPYIPQEKQLEYIQKVLKLIYRYKFGFTCITKSTLILRDIDLFDKINRQTKAVIQVSLTCTDDNISDMIEENISNTNERIKILRECQKRQISVVVWMTPILPYITDDAENINRILDYCIKYNVKGIINFGMGMTLREGNREYYYKKLDENFPGLKQIYEKNYKDKYSILSPKNNKLMKIFYEKTRQNNIMNNPQKIFDYLNEFPHKKITRQTTLF